LVLDPVRLVAAKQTKAFPAHSETEMNLTPAFRRIIAVAVAAATLAVAGAPSAYAIKKAVVGPVAFDVPDDFTTATGTPPSLHEDTSGITLEISELPPQALQEFKGNAFLEFLASLGYANAAYAAGALKRTDTHTYVVADAKGHEGPESRFLLVLGGPGRAAIVTAYVLKSQIDNGHASRAGIETILSSASVVPVDAAKP
jgi:hypothetical protein